MNDDATKDPSPTDIPLDTVEEKAEDTTRNVDVPSDDPAPSRLQEAPKESDPAGPEETKSDQIEESKSTHEEESKPAQNESTAAQIEANEGDTRDDSEAETVVMSGKEEESNKAKRKSIKHEGKTKVESSVESNAEPKAEPKVEAKAEVKSKEDGLDERAPNKDSKPSDSPRRKKGSKDLGVAAPADASYSSNLSSTISSPAPDPQSSSRAGSESAQSPRSRSTVSNANTGSHPPSKDELPQSRKRKLRAEENDEKDQQRPKKRGTSSEATNQSGRRENRKVSIARSESPPTRPRNRAPSNQSSSTGPHTVQKRRKPPPLQVNQKRKASEEDSGESEDSGSAHGRTHLSRLASAENTAMSPAKLSHKRAKDKNGRTWLARACAAGEIDNVIARLKERPEDLDVADNALNTPLQIASLAGNAKIVELLLNANCKTDCENIEHDTPLIDAVENGHLDVIKLLLKAGINPRQANSKGEEAVDLVDPDSENYHAIRTVLLEARAKDKRRRSSDDHHGPPLTGKESISASPALNNEPTAPVFVGRRRTGRSEATRPDLLWVTPSDENLRIAAAKGDEPGVNHILQMHPSDDIESVLAAAKGGHEVCLQLLIAMGNPEHDPDPLPSFKDGYNTPMLASIGRGNLRVIQLLLEQTGFNPTRRLYRHLTYHQLAKERQGSNWQEEYKILKDAYDKHIDVHGPSTDKSVGDLSPRSQKRHKLAKNKPTRPSDEQRKPKLELTSKDEPKKPQNGQGNGPEDKKEKSREKFRKHLRVPPDEASRESSVLISDRDVSPHQAPTEKKLKRSMSDGTAKDDAPIKPRKRLMSRKDLKNDEEKKRRLSLASVASSSSREDPKQPKSVQGKPLPIIKKEESRDGVKVPNLDGIKKRMRRSASPSHSNDLDARRVSDIGKKVKRQRVDSQGTAVEKRSSSVQSGAAKVANMGSSSNLMSAPPPPGAAPVAFMGSSNPSGVSKQSLHTTKSSKISSGVESDEPKRRNHSQKESSSEPVEQKRRTSGKEPSSESMEPKRRVSSKEALSEDKRSSPGKKSHTETGDPKRRVSGKEVPVEDKRSAPDKDPPPEAITSKRRASRSDQPKEKAAPQAQTEELPDAEVQAQRQLEQEAEMLEKQAAEKAALEEAERVAKEEERLRLEEQRRAEELAEKARLEKARLEQEEEEARLEKIRKEEEQLRLVAERERQRKEEQQRQAIRRAEKQEHERLERIKAQEAAELKRRESLPNSLRIAAELSPEEARNPSEIAKWLPIYTTPGYTIDPDCDEQGRDERWISNLQAAPILGITDLELSQYTAWTRIPLDNCHRFPLWRVLRVKLTRFEVPRWEYKEKEDLAADAATRIKYDALEHIFWIKLTDFMDIVQRFPHLTGIRLRTNPLKLPPKTKPQTNGVPPSATNGHQPSPTITNGNLTNGFH